MILQEDMKFGLRVVILADDNLGREGFVEAPAFDNKYYVVIPGIERYFIYSLKELEKATG